MDLPEIKLKSRFALATDDGAQVWFVPVKRTTDDGRTTTVPMFVHGTEADVKHRYPDAVYAQATVENAMGTDFEHRVGELRAEHHKAIANIARVQQSYEQMLQFAQRSSGHKRERDGDGDTGDTGDKVGRTVADMIKERSAPQAAAEKEGGGAMDSEGGDASTAESHGSAPADDSDAAAGGE